MATREVSVLNCVQYTRNLYWFRLLLAVSFTWWTNAQSATSATVRLSDGGASWRGNVEVYYDNEWGLVCHDSWDLNDGRVVCRELGFAGVREVYDGAEFGLSLAAPYPLLFDVECTGAESRLQDCNGTWGGYSIFCSFSEAAGVACIATSGAPDIKLVGGAYPNQGRVEIFLWEQWGTVCNTAWGIESANVVCRQLGYESAVELIPDDTFGDGEGTVRLDDVKCRGDEVSIYFCDHDGVGYKSCGYSSSAVGVLCKSDVYPNYVVPLPTVSPSPTPNTEESSPVWKAIIGIAVLIAILLCCCWCCRAVCKDEPKQQITANAVLAQGNTYSQHTSVPAAAPPPAEVPSAVNQSSVAYPIGVAPPPDYYPPGGIPPSAAYPPSANAPPSAPYPPPAYEYQPATAPLAPNLPPPGYDSVIKEPEIYSCGPSSTEKSANGSGTAPDAPPHHSQPAVVFNPNTDTVNLSIPNTTSA